MPQLHNIGEDALISQITSALAQRDNVIIGPGDDCAVVVGDAEYDTLLKTDCVIENVHYLSGENPYWVGWKAVARVVSDFAAMGGRPEALVITIILSRETETEDVKMLYTGMQACAERFQVSIVGGETSQLPSGQSGNIISVAGTGKVEKGRAVLRSGAQQGDHIYVTGKLGGSLAGHHLTFIPRVDEAVWLSKYARVTSMMDLSDGLGKDLPRLSKASDVGFTLDFEKLPLNADCGIEQGISDGEDYELIFTAPPLSESVLCAWAAAFPDTLLTQVGEVIGVDEQSTELTGGWEHFLPKSNESRSK